MGFEKSTLTRPLSYGNNLRTPRIWEDNLFCEWVAEGVDSDPHDFSKHSVNSSYRKAISHATLSEVWGVDFFATYNCLFFICSIAALLKERYT